MSIKVPKWLLSKVAKVHRVFVQEHGNDYSTIDDDVLVFDPVQAQNFQFFFVV